MKIVIATPIYPPEIGGPATYPKELCRHISKNYDITVVAYTDSYEAFPNTKLISVSKHRSLPVRLIKYFLAVWKVSRNADLIYVQNAMAAGLPVALVSILRGIPFILKFVGDEAWERATQHHLTEKRLEEFLKNPDGGFKIKMMMAVQGFVLRKAKLVTTPSVYLGEDIGTAYNIDPKRVITSFAAEIPTVATDISGTNEAIYHEKTGLLVKPGDTEGLALAIQRLFEDKELCGELVQNGTKLLEEKFSWKKHVEILNGFFQSVLSKPSN